MDRFKKFEQSYNEAKENIASLLEDNDPQVKHIVNWLFTTEHNPYGIFHKEYWANTLDYAEGFAALCNNLHHSLVDDGDICFPVINGQPMISFENRYDKKQKDWFSIDQIRTAEFFKELANKHPEKTYKNFNTVTFLDNVFQFTEAFDAREEENKRKHSS